MKTILDYINESPLDRQPKLMEIYHLIQEAAPMATEKFSYSMPTFYLNGNLVHFANAKHHLGFYPSPSTIQKFAEQLKPYKTSKGAIQFRYDESLPRKLISDIVAFRVAEQAP